MLKLTSKIKKISGIFANLSTTARISQGCHLSKTGLQDYISVKTLVTFIDQWKILMGNIKASLKSGIFSAIPVFEAQ